LIFEKAFLFALTGSSARKLRRGAANMLAGRAFIFNLYPLTAYEMGRDFDLQKALQFGTLPGCWNLLDDVERQRYLNSYGKTYLQEEVIAEQLIRNQPPFRRFLEVAALAHTEI